MAQTLSIAGTRAHAATMLRRLVGWPTLVVLLAPALAFAPKALDGDVPPLAATVIVFCFPWVAARLFIRGKLECDDQPMPGEGMGGRLSADLVRSLHGRAVITGGDLLQAAVLNRRGAFVVRQMGLDPAGLVARCRAEMDAHDPMDFIEQAARIAAERNETRVTAPVVILHALRVLPEAVAVLRDADLSQEDVVSLLAWEASHHELLRAESSWSPEGLARSGSIGRSWVMGYTDALDRLTVDIAEHVSLTGERKVVIHKDGIESMRRVIARSAQRNVLVLGKAGVGKRTMVENFAALLRQSEREGNRAFTRVLQLKTQDLVSGTASPDRFLLDALNRAQSSGSFILVIRDIATFLSSGSDTLRSVLMKFLEARNIAIVGIADIQDYHALIKVNPLLDSLFEKITVEDASDEEAMSVLMARTLTYERKHVAVTYKALRSVLELGKRYLGGKGFPGAAREVLDDAVLRAVERGDKVILEDHVRDVISLKGKVNVQKITEGERERLLGLEETMRRKVIGQDAAVRAVASALKRARADLGDRKRPIGTFLFLGPTGVGKTQAAKTLAEEFYGSADAMIRLDMNEYSHADSVFGITGNASGGGSKEGYLSQRVQDKPFSLILLDEIEKAHPSVLNLFLQILDEGRMTDARGVKTDFRNTIIIATSNAGALFIRDFMKQHPDASQPDFKGAVLETILQQKLFSPEFVNRFDEVVLFEPLRHEHARQVAILMIDSLVRELQSRRGITVQIDSAVLDKLVERGYSVEFGAREMRRVITERIEDFLADYLLRHQVQRGDVIPISAESMQW